LKIVIITRKRDGAQSPNAPEIDLEGTKHAKACDRIQGQVQERSMGRNLHQVLRVSRFSHLSNPSKPDKQEPIPEITKSERKELVAEDLKDYFPDSDIAGLVVRRRKNSSASIDLDAPAIELEETLSTNRRRGSSVFEMSENGDSNSVLEENPRKSSENIEEDFDQFLAKGYRRRSIAEGTNCST
jgi:hypothetical protein